MGEVTGRRGMVVAIVVAIAALCSVAAATAADKPPAPAHPAAGKSSFGLDVMPGEVIVHYAKGVSAGDRSAAMRAADASFGRDLLLARTELVEVEEGDEREAAAALEDEPGVRYAEPNAILHATATPNDTRMGDLWGMHNTGQTVNGVAGTADADIDAPEAWNMGTGLPGTVRVAVADSGVAMSHPDLSANIFRNPGESGGGKETNGIDDDGNGLVDDFRGYDFINDDNDPSDDNEHGTHVAGTIAGRANNAQGVAGAASFKTASGQWLGPRIVPVKVLDEEGSGTLAAIADGFVYSADIGAKVVNASLGGAGTSSTLDNAIRTNPSTLYVVAAGNDGVNNDTSPHTPCVAATAPDPPNKICVAATDSRDQLAGFSNFGATNVDLAGPGVSTLSTIPHRTFLQDDFEVALAGRWITNDAGQSGAPRWATTTAFATSPTRSVTDSPAGAYVNNQDNWIRNATGLNLAGGNGCTVTAQAQISTESGFDFFTVEASRTPTNQASWQEIFAFSGTGAGRVVADLSAFDGMSNVFIRFRLTSDASVNGQGAFVDDAKVKCLTSVFNTTSFEFFNGTSMATPHVAGAAAFLYTRTPGSTPAQVKDKLLRSVDPKASLSGRVATGGRLNMYKALAESTASKTGGVLTFNAGAGQTNNVTVTRFVDGDGVAKYRITDPYSTATGAIQSGSRVGAGAGCARVNETTVKCPVAGITRIVVNGGDLNDTLNASTIAIPVTVNGGPGSDSLTGGTRGDSLIGGPSPDRFTAGAGNDTISARNEDADTSFSCGENAGDSDTVNADLSPADPVAPNAANCEVVNKS